MATTTTTVAAKGDRAPDPAGLIAFLAAEGEPTVREAVERCGEAAVAAAWSRGEVEFGRTKYVVTGNPETNVTVHNGVSVPPAAVVVEGGLEWTGPKQRWHQPFSRLRGERLPAAPRYQKYQLEVCLNKEKDVWEWLEEGQSPGRRETRYARRDIDRAEADRLFELHVRLTDKGLGVAEAS